jgi:hypothetical protein
LNSFIFPEYCPEEDDGFHGRGKISTEFHAEKVDVVKGEPFKVDVRVKFEARTLFDGIGFLGNNTDVVVERLKIMDVSEGGTRWWRIEVCS